MTTRARVDRIERRAAALREAADADAPAAERDVDDERDTAREAEAEEAPWSPLPIQGARQFIADHPEAGIEVVFPTVYEEDRSAKIADLAQAQSLNAVTHRRMSEQVAKELGYEDYDYVAEQAQIRDEQRQAAINSMGAMGLGVGDGLAQRVAGALGRTAEPADDEPAGGPTSGPAGRPDLNGGPAAAGRPIPGRGDELRPEPRRADIAGDAAHRFRQQQREAALFELGLLGTLADLRREVDDLRARLREAVWDPAAHPRAPAGSPEGGQFVAGAGGGSGGSGNGATRQEPERPAPGPAERPADPEPEATAGWGRLLGTLSQPDGGFTVSPMTREMETTGKIVSIYPDRADSFALADLTGPRLARFVERNDDLFARPGHYFGAWHDPQSHMIWLDISVRVETAEEAERLAKTHKQIAYFDLDRGESVTVTREAAGSAGLRRPIE